MTLLSHQSLLSIKFNIMSQEYNKTIYIILQNWVMWQYLDLIALPHRESNFSSIIHKDLATNDLQNISRFFIPCPPLDLGCAKVVHFTNGIPFVCLLVLHRKERCVLLIFVRIPFRIYVIESEYTGMVWSTTLRSTKLPLLKRKWFSYYMIPTITLSKN